MKSAEPTMTWDEVVEATWTPEAIFAAAVLLAPEDVRRELATEFEVAKTTVDRWATGIARPHPNIHKRVAGFLKARGIETRSSP